MIHLDDKTVKRLRVMQRLEKDKRVYIKVTVLLMLHHGFTPQMIGESLGIDDSTVYRYRQGFEELGLEDYLKTFFVAYSGQLSEAEEQQLLAEVRGRLYINSKEVAAYIESAFGVRYSLSAVVKLLHRLGFSYKKTKGVGVKADRSVFSGISCGKGVSLSCISVMFFPFKPVTVASVRAFILSFIAEIVVCVIGCV